MTNQQLRRFLAPRSISIHGGLWAENVVRQLQRSNFQGDVFVVHPERNEMAGAKCIASIAALPVVPDASFVGVRRDLSIEVVRQLSEAGAGGAICFASGFSEADNGPRSFGADLQKQLVMAAADMPLLGPNCYGYLNYLDNVTLWPDQHGGQTIDRGVAIVAQSSNVAINMTMQKRGLSLAYMFTVGNQASIGLNQLAEYAIDDPRVTTVGLFIEGFGNLREFESMAEKARLAGKAIVAIKLGKSVKAQQATITHTATLAGGSSASSAFLRRLGIVEVDSLSCFIETLKFLHIVGPLSGPRLISVSCSGGEASLVADSAHNSPIEFPDLRSSQCIELAAVLGDKVCLANPLDYHTYIWGDVDSMTKCFAIVMRGDVDLCVFILDLPRSDLCETSGHRCAIDAIIRAKQLTQARVAVISSLPENIDEAITAEFCKAGVAVLNGLDAGMGPIVAAVRAGDYQSRSKTPLPVCLSRRGDEVNTDTRPLLEDDAKRQLSDYGVSVPNSLLFSSKSDIVTDIEEGLDLPFPMVLKGLGLDHKSEHSAIVAGIKDRQSLRQAIGYFPDCPDGYLLEQMITDSIAEIIVGITRDSTGLMALTIGAGGILTELLSDRVTLLIPTCEASINEAISGLKVNTILMGHRGRPAANYKALVESILAIQNYALDRAEKLYELDVNPLIVGKNGCYAVDALIRIT